MTENNGRPLNSQSSEGTRKLKKRPYSLVANSLGIHEKKNNDFLWQVYIHFNLNL